LIGFRTSCTWPVNRLPSPSNQLSSIRDAVTGNSYTGDIKSQSAYNYTYNVIGELTGDVQQEITNVTWNVYGKILSLSDSGNTISFTYDAAGNRISKTAHGITTWYVRDAQGNVMSVYTQGNSAINSGALTQSEAHLYGSIRLGLLDLSVNCGTSLTQPTSLSLVRGNKLFELTNHLGNVLETISDKKVQHTSDNSTVDYYLADVLNANDYYSFGMGMPARSYNATTAANYRYGFNGKEQDPEVKGAGDQYDYGMRMYDPRVGRFLSTDPLTKQYPWYTPYQFSGNTSIAGKDRDGEETMIPLNGVGLSGTPMSNYFDNKEGRKLWMKAMGIELGIGAIALTDIFLTKGRITTTLLVEAPFYGSFEHNRSRTLEGRIEQDNRSKEGLTTAFVNWSMGRVTGSLLDVVKEGFIATKDVIPIFRGTSVGFEGNAAQKALGISPGSTDPAVATMFATQSENYGEGILYISNTRLLGQVGLTANVLKETEIEVAAKIKPADYAKYAQGYITASEARSILKSIGVEVPSRISRNTNISTLLEGRTKMTKEQIDKFTTKALEIIKNREK